MALGYALAAILMFLLIITIPFAFQALKLASFSLWPFGRTLVKKPDSGAASVLGNLLWVVLAGWWIALGHLVSAVFLTITVIGIPFAIAHLKLAGTALWPMGRDIVPIGSVTSSEHVVAVATDPLPQKSGDV